MENAQKDRPSITFSVPDSVMHTVTVYRVLPDNTTEPIGKIFPDFSNGEDFPMYISTDTKGVQIFPLTSDFLEIEERFSKYAKEQSMQSFTEQIMAEADKISERKAAICKLRNRKIMKTQQIIR